MIQGTYYIHTFVSLTDRTMRKQNGTQGFEYQPGSEKWIRKKERESDEKLVQYRKLSMQICNKNNPHCV